MLEKNDLLKLVEKYEALHIKNYDNYQECGERKYLRASERYEDMAQAFQMAADAYDTKQTLNSLSSFVAQYAAEGDKAIYHNDDEGVKSALKNIISIAETHCGYWSKYKDMKKNLG